MEIGESPAIQAFDAIAEQFDRRFAGWRSVAAQRNAVRHELLRVFAPGSSLLELGGGTGEDAIFMAQNERSVLLTDGSPTMMARASAKIEDAGCGERIVTRVLPIEQLASLTQSLAVATFDGAYSNFAAFNCVEDRTASARALASLVRRGGSVVVVVFGPFSAGELVCQLLRGDPRAAFRRLHRNAVPARVSGHQFNVFYPRPGLLAREFAPWFRLQRVVGIGILVPPSAAEPGISRWPRVLRVLEAGDRVLNRPLAYLGDHVLLHFTRTSELAG